MQTAEIHRSLWWIIILINSFITILALTRYHLLVTLQIRSSPAVIHLTAAAETALPTTTLTQAVMNINIVFSAKVDTIIRRLRLMERAKRKWNCTQRHTLTLKCVTFVTFVTL